MDAWQFIYISKIDLHKAWPMLIQMTNPFGNWDFISIFQMTIVFSTWDAMEFKVARPWKMNMAFFVNHLMT